MTATSTAPDYCTVAYSSNPDVVVSWLRERGYRGVPAGMPGCTSMGVLFSRWNGPAHLAVVGETLAYDGWEVVVVDG